MITLPLNLLCPPFALLLFPLKGEKRTIVFVEVTSTKKRGKRKTQETIDCPSSFFFFFKKL